MAAWSASVDSGVKPAIADHRGYTVDVKVRVKIRGRVRGRRKRRVSIGVP